MKGAKKGAGFGVSHAHGNFSHRQVGLFQQRNGQIAAAFFLDLTKALPFLLQPTVQGGRGQAQPFGNLVEAGPAIGITG